MPFFCYLATTRNLARTLPTPWAKGINTMPEICRFYGIVIRMYYDEHPPPHFHVSYHNTDAVLRIDTLDVIRGALPRRALALVLEWAMAHRDELRQNWTRLERGEPLSALAPLD